MCQKEIIKRILKEESDELSIDKSILNFLRRHSKIDERNIGDGEHPIKVKSVSFNIDDEWYSISSFMSKKDMKNKILRMLEDNQKIGEYDPSVLDTDRQKVVRTIKEFINTVMS
jgi:hypothetical protein